MTSKFANYHRQNQITDRDSSSPIPLRFPSSSRLLRKKTYQIQKTRSLRETLSQLVEFHKEGPPPIPDQKAFDKEKEKSPLQTPTELILNADKSLTPLRAGTPPTDPSPTDPIQDYVKSHTHLLDSISYLLRLRCGPLANKQSPVTYEASVEDLVQAIRLSLCSEWAAVRASALQCFRVLLRTPEVEQEAYRQILNFGVDVLVARCLDAGILEGGYDMELVQGLRLLYLFVQRHTSAISRPLLASLISIASTANADNKVFRTCLALLGLLAAKQPQLLQETGGIRTLVQGVLTCSDMHMNESLIASLVSLLSHPSTRLVVNLLHELQPLLAPFTDPHYMPHFFEASRKETKTPADLEKAHEQARKQAVNACASAFTSLFLSWSGFLSLSQEHECSSLKGFLAVLPLAIPLQQHAMLDALFRILLIAPPASSSIDQLFESLPLNRSDRRTRSLVTPFSNQGLASLAEDWVTYESEKTMPYVCKSRTDLAQCYRVLVMSILFEQHILIRLLEMSIRAPEPIIVKAIILAKEILVTLQKLFPLGLDIAEQTDTSITKFLNTEAKRGQLSKASKVAVLLQRLYLLERDSSEENYSRFLLLLAKPPRTNLLSSVLSNRAEEAGLLKCIDDISDSITDAGDISNFSKWDWDKIKSLLSTIQPTTAIVQKLNELRIFKRILNFYLPSSQLFYKLPLKAEFDHYVEAGLSMITFLISSAWGNHLYPLLHQILDKIRMFLDEEGNKKTILKEHTMSSSLAQAYFLFLGHISHLNWKILLELGYPGLLLELFILRSPNKTLIKLLLPTLVYYGPISPQSFSLLQVAAMSNDCQDTRIFCIKFMRTLLRCQKSNFSSQGIRLLVLLIHDENSAVREEAIKVLDEACEINKHLLTLSSLKPQISHLCLSGYLIFMRLFSIEENYALFKSTGVLQHEVKKWIEVKNIEYVELVERSIAEGFTHYIHTKPGEFKRRSTVSEIDLAKKQVFVPVHLFGQLTAHFDGCCYIKTNNLLDALIDTVKKQRLADSRDVLEMKAAIWALGHIGSRRFGVELLIQENLINDLVDMCANSPVLTVRGTCYYSISLIAKTLAGSDYLYKLGWVSVRHGNETKWPLANDSLRDLSNWLEQDSFRDDGSYCGKSSYMKSGGNHIQLSNSLNIPEKSDYQFSSLPSQDSNNVIFRNNSPEPISSSLDLETVPQQAFSLPPIKKSQSFINRRNSRDILALNPNFSKSYIGLAIPIHRNSILQLSKDKVTCTRIFSPPIPTDEFNWEMKRDPNKIQIVIMDSTGKFRHRTHTGDSAFSSQSGISGVSPTVLTVPTSLSPNKKLSCTSPRGISPKDAQGTSSPSDHSSSVTVSAENLIEAVSQLSSNLSLESKRNTLIKMKAKHHNLFNDLHTYIQVVIILSNYRFSLENRKFIQAMFDQTVFDSLFDNISAGNGESTNLTDFSTKSLTPDLRTLDTQTHLQVGEEDDDDSQARRRCSTGDAVKLKIKLKRKIDAEDTENREELRIDTTKNNN